MAGQNIRPTLITRSTCRTAGAGPRRNLSILGNRFRSSKAGRYPAARGSPTRGWLGPVTNRAARAARAAPIQSEQATGCPFNFGIPAPPAVRARKQTRLRGLRLAHGYRCPPRDLVLPNMRDDPRRCCGSARRPSSAVQPSGLRRAGPEARPPPYNTGKKPKLTFLV